MRHGVRRLPVGGGHHPPCCPPRREQGSQSEHCACLSEAASISCDTPSDSRPITMASRGGSGTRASRCCRLTAAWEQGRVADEGIQEHKEGTKKVERVEMCHASGSEDNIGSSDECSRLGGPDLPPSSAGQPHPPTDPHIAPRPAGALPGRGRWTRCSSPPAAAPLCRGLCV